MKIIEGLDFTSLLKARSKFEQFRRNLSTDQDKAGSIQSFKYTYELAWKMMRKMLIVRGREFNSPREVFRAAALEGFVKDPEVWFMFLKARNSTVHSYDEVDADAVIAVFEDFSCELGAFLIQVGIIV